VALGYFHTFSVLGCANFPLFLKAVVSFAGAVKLFFSGDFPPLLGLGANKIDPRFPAVGEVIDRVVRGDILVGPPVFAENENVGLRERDVTGDSTIVN